MKHNTFKQKKIENEVFTNMKETFGGKLVANAKNILGNLALLVWQSCFSFGNVAFRFSIFYV